MENRIEKILETVFTEKEWDYKPKDKFREIYSHYEHWSKEHEILKDWIQTLLATINEASANIHQYSCGSNFQSNPFFNIDAGEFVVIPQEMKGLIMDIQHFEKPSKKVVKGFYSQRYLGNLSNRYDVFIDEDLKDEIIVTNPYQQVSVSIKILNYGNRRTNK